MTAAADSNFSDTDSGFGASIASTDSDNSQYATTIASEVLNYVYENGRRYHSYREGIYVLPNDDREIERLDLYHHIFKAALGGALYAAPLENVKNVLDVGTGTGAWAIDYADQNPEAEVIGNDLSQIQPSWVPPNCHFELDDAESIWTHHRDSFDYIHMRSLSGCFADWNFILSQCYDHTKPGGYIEFQDYSCELFTADSDDPDICSSTPTPISPASPLAEWWNLVVTTANHTGRPFQIASKIKSKMEAAGFVDVVQKTDIWPLSPWHKNPRVRELGKWALCGMIESLNAFSVALLTRVLGWETEEVLELCRRATVDLKDGRKRYYSKVYFVYGRKPLDAKRGSSSR